MLRHPIASFYPAQQGYLLLAMTLLAIRPKNRPMSPSKLHKNGFKCQHGPHQRSPGPKNGLSPQLNESLRAFLPQSGSGKSFSPVQRPQATVDQSDSSPSSSKPSARNPKLGRHGQAAGDRMPSWGELYGGTGGPHATQMGAAGTTTALKTWWVLEKGQAPPWAAPAWWF